MAPDIDELMIKFVRLKEKIYKSLENEDEDLRVVISALGAVYCEMAMCLYMETKDEKNLEASLKFIKFGLHRMAEDTEIS